MVDVARSSPDIIHNKRPASNPRLRKMPKAEDSVLSNGVGDEHESLNGTEEESHNGTHEVEDIASNAEEEVPDVEDVTEKADDDEVEGVEAVGSVNDEHNIVDEEGHVLGTVGDEIPEGSLVDTEGDVLDEEGNVIGKADLASEAAEGVEDATKGTTEGLAGATESIKDAADGATSEVPDKPEEETEKLQEGIEGSTKDTTEGVEGATDGVKDAAADATSEVPDKAEGLDDPTEKTEEGVDGVKDTTEEPTEKLEEGVEGAKDGVKDTTEEPTEKLEEGIEGAKDEVEEPTEKLEDGVEGAKDGLDEPTDKVEEGVEDIKDTTEEAINPLTAGPFAIGEGGEITNATGLEIGKLAEGEDAKDLGDRDIVEIDQEGNLKVESGSVVGQADINSDILEQAKEATKVPLSVLEGLKVNKLGKIVNEDGIPIGQLIEGDPKKLAGKKVDAEGQIWDDKGKVIGRAEPLQDVEKEAKSSSPFEDFPDSVVDAKGNVIFEGKVVGKVVEGDAKKLEGKKVDEDGDILDKNGNSIGRAERYQEEEAEPEPEPEKEDLSELDGKKVNKAGNLVDSDGKLFGRVKEGVLAKLIGKKSDAEGKIYSDSGKVIGAAELIPIDERDADTDSPFEDFPDAVVDSKGNVTFEGQVIGKLIQGDAKKLAGKKVDKDGDVIDKVGNVVGKAERWEEEEAPAPEKVDNSALAGKRVNKLGNVVDSAGQIYGRLVEGDPKKLAGKMCDREGNVKNEMGDTVGRAELVPESEREGEKTGPFADFDNPTVAKDGKVTDAKGQVIGRLIQGDAKQLLGKIVDPDGDVLDKNGNTLGKAERWEEEEKEIAKHPAAGRKVNKKGEVVDENGDTIAKLTDGDLQKCAGKSIDNDGDVVDGKGASIGHVTLLEDIPEPEVEPEPEPVVEEEPKESEEEIAERKQIEADNKLAGQLASVIEGSIDKIQPILKMITETIDAAERQPKDELDEQKLVDTVKPLLEEGGQILQEANGAIRALDPDGRIQNNAKHKTSAREASPEEYRLADKLKELSSGVMTTIEKAKKKIAGMPHAKKELNPLWNLLAEPLGQIIAAVGLLLSGVLGLVGRLLSGLGLGGLLDNLLGGLGIKQILGGLGLGMVTKSLTGK